MNELQIGDKLYSVDQYDKHIETHVIVAVSTIDDKDVVVIKDLDGWCIHAMYLTYNGVTDVKGVNGVINSTYYKTYERAYSVGMHATVIECISNLSTIQIDVDNKYFNSRDDYKDILDAITKLSDCFWKIRGETEYDG